MAASHFSRCRAGHLTSSARDRRGISLCTVRIAYGTQPKDPWRNAMENASAEGASALLALSNDLAAAVGHAAPAVVAVCARPRVPSSGVQWRRGVIVTADHTLRRDEDIMVGLADGRTLPAALAGRDASTDLAVLRLQEAEWPVADIGDDS